MRHLFASLTLLLLLTPEMRAQSRPDTDFDAVLQAFVSDRGVHYGRLLAHRESLDRYIGQLGAVTAGQFESWPRNDQIAYLLNAYNAIVLQQVIDHYPIRRSLNPAAWVRPANSIWQISGFFGEIRHRVAGQDLTLDQIEHDLLRARFMDPRIHAALVCAAVSCPPLRTEAYRGDALDAQLAEQWRAFLSDPHRNLIDREHGTLRLSEIFKWFGDDFGGADGVAAFVAGYVDPKTAAWLRTRRARLSYFDYDWNLNDAGTR